MTKIKYKTLLENRKKSLEYYHKNKKKISIKQKEFYYKNRNKILKRQTKLWIKKYKNNLDFRKKRQFRDKSRWKYDKNLFNKICYFCFSKKDLQRHHLNYEDLEYIILCRRCHNNLHYYDKQFKSLDKQTS